MLARQVTGWQRTTKCLPCQQTWRLSFASLPAPELPSEANEAAAALVVHAQYRQFLLVQQQERRWGSTPQLSPSAVAAMTDKAPENLGLLRNPALTAQQEQVPLSSMLQRLKSGQLAITTEGARLVVDQYSREESGEYGLRRTSVPILEMIRTEQKRILPDLETSTLNFHEALTSSGGQGQSTRQVLMVAPTAFTFNQQAAADNRFMHSQADAAGPDPAARVLAEHNGLYEKLTNEYGVTVQLFEHSPQHDTPDAVFPNNWFSTHAQGEARGGVQQRTLVYYPMKCPNRAKERREDIQAVIQRGRVSKQGVERVLDFSAKEQQHKYLEGTGAFVLDRVNGVAYLNVSERADAELAQQWVQDLGYRELVTFKATGAEGSPIYHTNVMMAIGSTCAVVCSESVADDAERQHLLARLHQTHQVIEITRDQMGAFCGNIIEVVGNKGLPLLAMSTAAHNAFTPEQRALLLKHVRWLCHSPIDTLEHIGGGGVRCSIAELF